jgi:hypothetical protein
VLSALVVCAAITAVVAGVTGAWSPCGFSMVETIGSALGEDRRSATFAASATFALGAMVGGVVTFGGLALLGRAAGPGAGGVRAGLGVTIAVAAAIADWRGVKIAPQIRRQVPERWRWTAPLALACGLYGILLGLAFTTFVLAFAVWALAGISFAAGDPLLGAVIGVAFGIGRALPVLTMAPGFSGGARGARLLDGMAREPRMWLGLRRLDALGLSLCAVFLSGESAIAAVLPRASDPSAAAGQLVWQTLGGPARLRQHGGRTIALAGADPALGGSRIAWQSDGTITIASSSGLVSQLSIAAPGVNALAVSDAWVVYRALRPDGGEALLANSLTAPAGARTIASSPRRGELGRPSLSGVDLLYSENTARRSALELVNLATGARRPLRLARRGAQLANPALLDGRLLYERLDRCSQQLLLGPARPGGAERVLLGLPSTATRDPGYQRGYEHAYNSASRCRERGPGRGAGTRLGATALGARAAFVTEVSSDASHARILTIQLCRALRRPARRGSCGSREARAPHPPGVASVPRARRSARDSAAAAARRSG